MRISSTLAMCWAVEMEVADNGLLFGFAVGGGGGGTRRSSRYS